MYVECTSYFSAQIMKRLGFEKVYTLKYSDYKVDGKVIFNPNPPHQEYSVYVQKLDNWFTIDLLNFFKLSTYKRQTLYGILNDWDTGLWYILIYLNSNIPLNLMKIGSNSYKSYLSVCGVTWNILYIEYILNINYSAEYLIFLDWYSYLNQNEAYFFCIVLTIKGYFYILIIYTICVFLFSYLPLFGELNINVYSLMDCIFAQCRCDKK